MNVSGIVMTHSRRSLPDKFRMNKFLGDKIFGLNITCSVWRFWSGKVCLSIEGAGMGFGAPSAG